MSVSAALPLRIFFWRDKYGFERMLDVGRLPNRGGFITDSSPHRLHFHEFLLVVDGSFLLGPGIALISTPGHAAGNQTLVLNTSTGIWCSSENAIATECMTPEHSKIPGIARWATLPLGQPVRAFWLDGKLTDILTPRN